MWVPDACVCLEGGAVAPLRLCLYSLPLLLWSWGSVYPPRSCSACLGRRWNTSTAYSCPGPQ